MSRLKITSYLFTLLGGLLIATALAEIYSATMRLFSVVHWQSALLANGFFAILTVVMYRKKNELLDVKPAHPQSARLLLFAKSVRLARPAVLAYLPAVVVLVVSILIAGISATQLSPTLERLNPPHFNVWVMFSTVLLVPMAEELTFRIGFGSWFRTRLGVLWGSWVSALFFSYLHSWPTLGNLIDMRVGLALGPFLLALVCEWLWYNFRRLAPLVCLHIACNSTVYIFNWIDDRWFSWLDLLYQ